MYLSIPFIILFDLFLILLILLHICINFFLLFLYVCK